MQSEANVMEGYRMFSELSDDELYILKRSLIESSYTINTDEKYTDKERSIHNHLLNSSIYEIVRRIHNDGL